MINIKNENDILNIKLDEIYFKCKVEDISIDQNKIFNFNNKNFRGILKLLVIKEK